MVQLAAFVIILVFGLPALTLLIQIIAAIFRSWQLYVSLLALTAIIMVSSASGPMKHAEIAFGILLGLISVVVTYIKFNQTK